MHPVCIFHRNSAVISHLFLLKLNACLCFTLSTVLAIYIIMKSQRSDKSNERRCSATNCRQKRKVCWTRRKSMLSERSDLISGSFAVKALLKVGWTRPNRHRAYDQMSPNNDWVEAGSIVDCFARSSTLADLDGCRRWGFDGRDDVTVWSYKSSGT